MTGDYAHSDGSHVPVRSRSVPWGGGGRWERRPWSGGAAVRRGGGRRGGWRECGSPASRAPRQAPWGAWRAPLGPQFTSPAPPTSLRWHRPPQAPLPFFRRSTADKSGGGKGGAEQARRGDKGAPRRAGTRSHWPPPDTSGQGRSESFLTVARSGFFSLEQDSTKSRVPAVCPGAELRDSSRPASALFCPLSTL